MKMNLCAYKPCDHSISSIYHQTNDLIVITRFLTIILGVPMAFITLIDSNPAWFKSAVESELAEIPRTATIAYLAFSEFSDIIRA